MDVDFGSPLGYNNVQRYAIMLTTLEGTYKDGRVELEEAPAGITEGRVLVTFLPNGNGTPAPKPPGQMMTLGCSPNCRELTDEDFKIGGVSRRPG